MVANNPAQVQADLIFHSLNHVTQRPNDFKRLDL